MPKSYDNARAAVRTMFIAVLLVLLAQPLYSQSKYIKKYRPLADSLESQYGVPSAIILGVAIIESGAGQSRNAKMLNNHFGIVGKNDVLRTKGIKTRYKQYPSIRASYLGFTGLMTRKKFYKKLKGNMDYKLWLDAMSKAGYSEEPEIWKQRITSAIKKHKLASNR